jgi:superfamily I DNA/RNA helicase
MCGLDGRQGIYHVDNYQKILNGYKTKYNLFDYTDILQMWAKHPRLLPLKVLIVDEAQDLCPLQWQIVHQMEREVPQVYYAGDDDQAIYQWTGADIEHFIGLKVNKKTVLPLSYRLPRQIFKKCNQIVRHIKKRYVKQWNPANREGVFRIVETPELIDFGDKEWLVLSRNHYHLAHLANYLKSKGHVFQVSGRSSLCTAEANAVKAWLQSANYDLIPLDNVKRILAKVPKHILKKDKAQLYSLPPDITVPKSELKDTYGIDLGQSWEASLALAPAETSYIRTVLKRYGSLEVNCKINLNTIHAVKGGECDNVAVLPDMAASCYDSFIKDSDAESRVFYVGCSRAKEQLVVCQPSTPLFYPM